MGAPRTRTRRRRFRSGPLVATLVATAVLLVAALLLTGPSVPIAQETAPVTVSGQALPDVADQGAEPAVGMPAPDARGRSIDGREVRLVTPGQPTAIVLLAHWCGHCQAEVSEMVDWLAERGHPSDVRLVAVSTLVNPDMPNYPASAWFEREGWPVETLMDDADSSVAEAFGLTGTPTWVFVGRDGDVAGRVTGRLGIPGLEAALTALAAD